MGDPLSIAASAAGLVSLGLTVCSGLIDYYNAWKDHLSDVSVMCDSLVSLKKTFELLDEKVRHPLLDRKSVDRVTESIISCAAGVQKLQSKLDKIRNAKPEKLLRTITDIRSNLSLATTTLQLDISMKSIHQLNQVDTDLRKLIDNSEVSSTKILESISKVHLGQEQEKLRTLSVEEREVINWLSPLEFLSKQNDALSRRHEGTGRWLLESTEFRSWLDTAGTVLWCPGMPGAGKTILASTVIDHLEKNYRREKTGIAYVYCVHNGVHQTVSNFLGSLLQQFTMQSVVSLEDIKSCYEHHVKFGTRPSINEISRLLRSQVEKLNEVFIVIDALDECPELDQTRKYFLAEVRGLLPMVRLMLTSRQLPSIENSFKKDARLEIRAQDQDVRKFIESQMERRDELVNLLEGYEDVKSSIIMTVLEKTKGMFLLAALHMDSLAKEDNVRDLKESLQRLPENLDMTYDDALERIKNQDSRKLARANQVLTLISCAKRPLKLEEMRQALSIRRGDTSLDPEALPKTESLISTCCGLVVVEDESQIVRLVHYTTQEYFKRKLQHYRSPEAHRYVASTLVTYLSFTTFTNLPLDRMIGNARNEAAARAHKSSMTWSSWQEGGIAMKEFMDSLFESHVLVQYAAENWGHHARDAFTNIRDDPNSYLATTDSHNREADKLWNFKQLTLDFLEKENNLACANEVGHYVKRELRHFFFGDQIRSPTGVTNLHVAASFGIKCLVEYCLNKRAEIDSRDSEGMTALHKAAIYGHVEVARLLLDSGATIDIQDHKRRSALLCAIEMNQLSVLRLLLREGSDLEIPSKIEFAVACGYEESLELLSEYETDTFRRNQLMGHALSDAAWRGQEGVVRLLTRSGNNWNISKRDLARAMPGAVSEGHVTIVKILLEAGVDVSSPLPLSRESLQEAAAHGYSEAIELPLTAGADPITKEKNSDPLLHEAIMYGRVEIVALLLENGADVDALDSKGNTAMVFLARENHLSGESVVSMTQQLLERGANTAATDCDFNRTSLEWAILHGDKGLVQPLLQYESFSTTRQNLMLYLARLYHALRRKNDEAVNWLLHEKEVQELGSVSKLLQIYIPAGSGCENAVRIFLEFGAAIDAKEEFRGETALHLAAQGGHAAVVELLLDKAADINARDSGDATPLIAAAASGRTAVVELLLEQGADIDATSTNTYFGTATARAVNMGYTATVKVLLERGVDANARCNSCFEGTLLHAAVESPNTECQIPNIDLLLEKGADLEAKDSRGQTPLAVAAQRYRLDTVKFLLEKGANLEARDINGQTPLVEAVRSGRLEMVHFLLERGADPHALSPSVTLDYDVVFEDDFDKAVELVLEAQSKTK